MKTSGIKGKTSSVFFFVLTALSFVSCFMIPSLLGNYILWISIGATVYFLFMAIYCLIPPPKKRFTKKKFDPKEAAMKAHTEFHLRMLLNLFLVAALLVAVFLFFVM